MIPENQPSETLGSLSVDPNSEEICKCPLCWNGKIDPETGKVIKDTSHTVTDCYDMQCDCCGTTEYTHDERKIK